MGIGRQVGDVYGVPNLFRNGGLDFRDVSGVLPAYYSINGALKTDLAEGVENTWEQVFDTVPDVAGAPSNYLRLLLPRDEPVTVGQDFATAFGGSLDHAIPIDPCELSLPGFQAEEMNLLYQGLFTFSFSIRVVKGEISVGFSRTNAVEEDSATDVYTEFDAAFSNKRWRRLTGVFDAGKRRLGVVGAQIRRRGFAQAVEVHVGNFMLGAGAYDELPYTGDLAAMAFPRGAVIMTIGAVCPPGFVPVEEDDLFPREGVPGESGGDLYHTHELDQRMSPAAGWPKRSLLDSGDAQGISGLTEDSASKADPADDHTHPIGGDEGASNTTPLFRGFLFCRRA